MKKIQSLSLSLSLSYNFISSVLDLILNINVREKDSRKGIITIQVI
ncbi:MAG TPA: hypothetical protein VKY57_04680 [Chitinispirillaceae bacterium]|nr:hypothetical protein [Chitinispirillaceae bacterium]